MKEQHTILSLGARRFHSLFSDALLPLCEKCYDLADIYSPGLKDQWIDGLVTGNEFINRLVDDVSAAVQSDGTLVTPEPVARFAAPEILECASNACRNLAELHVALAEKLCHTDWLTWRISNSPFRHYTLCCKLAESFKPSA